MDRLHQEQLKDLEKNHKQEVDELKAEHLAELTRLTVNTSIRTSFEMDYFHFGLHEFHLPWYLFR